MNYKASFAIQWHLTNKCQKRCKHCYMYDNNYKEMLLDELNFDEITNILSDFDDFEKKWKIKISSFFLTGGDPFLRDDFELILSELYKREKKIYIMANPESVTYTNIKLIKKFNIGTFQISLDGLEKTHDYYRGKGDFQRAIQKIDILNNNGIDCRIMFTLTNDNKEELFPLIEFLAKFTTAKGFAFDLCVNSGNAKDINTDIKNKELITIFNNYLELKRKFKNKGIKLHLAEKPTLMRLLHFAKGEYPTFFSEKTPIVTGCLIGTSCITIMPNGDIEACRRYPSTLGNLRKEKLENIILGNETLKKFRRPQFYEDCGTCLFFKFCRGCPALTGKFDTKQIKTLCIKNELGLTKKLMTFLTPIPLSSNFEEEAQLIYSFMQNKYDFKYSDFYKRDKIQNAVGGLIIYKKLQKKLCNNPKEFKIEFNLEQEELEYIQYYFIAAIKYKKIFSPLEFN